jgi:hypothetical protein
MLKRIKEEEGEGRKRKRKRRWGYRVIILRC